MSTILQLKYQEGNRFSSSNKKTFEFTAEQYVIDIALLFFFVFFYVLYFFEITS